MVSAGAVLCKTRTGRSAPLFDERQSLPELAREGSGSGGPPRPSPGPPSVRRVRAACACSGRHSSVYDDATIWLDDVKSRLPPVSAYEMTPKSMPNAAPIPMGAMSGTASPGGEKKYRTTPTKRPNQAPEPRPASATRG